jgi:hypothetical protein
MAVLPRDARPTKRSWRSPATAEAPAGVTRRLGIFPFPAIAGEPEEPAQSLKLVSRWPLRSVCRSDLLEEEWLLSGANGRRLVLDDT